MGSRERNAIGDTKSAIALHHNRVPRTLGAGIEVRGVQTEDHFFEEEVTKIDKGVEVRRGRRHNNAHTLFMNNNAQTDTERRRYSWFVVAVIAVSLLNVWYTFVSLNIHYKLLTPVEVVEKPSEFNILYPFRIFKYILPNAIVRLFTDK